MDQHYIDIPNADQPAGPPTNVYERMGPLDNTNEYTSCDYDEKQEKGAKSGKKAGKNTSEKASIKSASLNRKSTSLNRNAKDRKVLKEKRKHFNKKILLYVLGGLGVGLAILLCLALAMGGIATASSCCSTRCSTREAVKEHAVNLSTGGNWTVGDSGALPLAEQVCSCGDNYTVTVATIIWGKKFQCR